MDPGFIALIGTLVGGIFIKGIDVALNKYKESGVSAISAGENYDRRFEDPEYVSMIHFTREKELVELGQIYTECECSSCKIGIEPPTTVKYTLPQRPVEEYSLQGGGTMRNDNGRITFHNKTVPNTAPYTKTINGFTFLVPGHIPKDASVRVEYDYKIDAYKALFKWTDYMSDKRYVEVVTQTTTAPERYDSGLKRCECSWGQIEAGHMTEAVKVYRDSRMCEWCVEQEARRKENARLMAKFTAEKEAKQIMQYFETEVTKNERVPVLIFDKPEFDIIKS